MKDRDIILPDHKNIFERVVSILEQARYNTVKSINSNMVLAYWHIGKEIVEEVQQGSSRAEYGKQVITDLSKKLTARFGKGFSNRNLKNMRKFYLTFSIGQNHSAQFKLNFSQYLILIRIENIAERDFYEIEAENNNWGIKELQRQINSALYERLTLKRDKEEINLLSQKGQIIESPRDLIKDPLVLEFLGLEESTRYSENDFESAIITHIETFIMELGKGFLFQGRQVRFSFEEEHFFVDLVFYNRILKCFVLIDLKIGKLKHQDIGQMQMYVNYYDRFIKLEEENKTIGIIICKDKKDTLIEITLPEENNQIFASKYLTILPTKEELKRIVEGS